MALVHAPQYTPTITPATTPTTTPRPPESASSRSSSQTQPTKFLPPFLQRLLARPAYAGRVPSAQEVLSHYVIQLRIDRDPRLWLGAMNLGVNLFFVSIAIGFFLFHFTWPAFFAGLALCSLAMNWHGTLYYHRLGSHRAFRARFPWALALLRHLAPRTVPEEVYVLSHQVHHAYSDTLLDPYAPRLGWLACMLADANHQRVSPDLSREDYARACHILAPLAHSRWGLRLNDYETYQRWGSLVHPRDTFIDFAINWTLWFSLAYALGGLAGVGALAWGVSLWLFSVRHFNYKSHGSGRDQRRADREVSSPDLSLNLKLAGWLAGEWHSNHHLVPRSARYDFRRGELDLSWLILRGLIALGLFTDAIDGRPTPAQLRHAQQDLEATLTAKVPL